MNAENPKDKHAQSATQQPQSAMDLEIKDAQLIFDSVWSSLEEELGRGGMRFPQETFWLNGSPGAGKGTQTRYIMHLRDLTAPPIVVSDLLKSPEAKRLIDAGMMVGDREVTNLVFRRLVDPINQSGAIVDGFPRTKTQVLILQMLYQKLIEERNRHLGTPMEEVFPRPQFHIIVLFIDEAESVRRQLRRGAGMQQHNAEVEASGVGQKIEVRKTDLSESAARKRYKTFKEVTYESLKSLREIFQYHFINAHGSVEEVQERIVDELRYQSSLELDEATYDRVSNIPISAQIVVHARQELVKRLNDYESQHRELFSEVVRIIQNKFMPIVKRHSISGMAYINSEEAVFDDPIALAMLIDIFSERGYHAVVDVRRLEVPNRFDLETGRIYTREKRVYRFRVTFAGTQIRRNR